MKLIFNKKKCWVNAASYQIVDLLVGGEEGLLVALLVVDEGLDVQVEGLAAWALGRLRAPGQNKRFIYIVSLRIFSI